MSSLACRRRALCGGWMARRSKLKASVGEAALWALAFFAPIGARINLAAFNAVIDYLTLLGCVQVFVLPVVVKPQTENHNQARSQVEQEKDIDI